jgi:hypothetical protein
LTAKIISTAVSVTLLIVVVVTHSVLVGGLAALLVVAAYAYSPRGYSISERSIIVERLIGDVRIPLDEIREARAATPDDFRGCIRLFGSGGLFGYYGVFLTSKLGRSTWYVTNRRNAVVVIAGAKTVVFSPGDVDRFVAAIRPLVTERH